MCDHYKAHPRCNSHSWQQKELQVLKDQNNHAENHKNQKNYDDQKHKKTTRSREATNQWAKKTRIYNITHTHKIYPRKTKINNQKYSALSNPDNLER